MLNFSGARPVVFGAVLVLGVGVLWSWVSLFLCPNLAICPYGLCPGKMKSTPDTPPLRTYLAASRPMCSEKGNFGNEKLGRKESGPAEPRRSPPRTGSE